MPVTGEEHRVLETSPDDLGQQASASERVAVPRVVPVALILVGQVLELRDEELLEATPSVKGLLRNRDAAKRPSPSSRARARLAPTPLQVYARNRRRSIAEICRRSWLIECLPLRVCDALGAMRGTAER